jgi:hypothetical protein
LTIDICIHRGADQQQQIANTKLVITITIETAPLAHHHLLCQDFVAGTVWPDFF